MKQTTRVTYKPDPQSTDEFIMIVNKEEYQKWKKGDKTIPLAEVVESFQIFFSNQGHQGHLGQASRQQLDTVFGTHKDIDVAEQLLEKGEAKTGEGFGSDGASKNDSHGSRTFDNRGSGAKLSGA